MELPRGYPSHLTFPIPGDVVITVNTFLNDVALPPFTVTADAGAREADIPVPYQLTHDEGTFTMEINFTFEGQSFTRKKTVDVYTPYLELWEVKKVLETDNEELCWTVESAVRHVINAHCGQEFGVTEEPQVIVGETENTLGFNRPVIRIDKLSEDGRDLFDRSVDQGAGRYLGMNQYTITGDGWYIKRPSYNVDSIKADRGSYYSANPIRRPNFSDNSFVNDSEYIVHGRFGYESVPEEVRQAAMLLVNDYACQDSLYRDRYLANIRAGDWRIEFNAGAWVATGNARADHLLAPHVVNRIVVI